MANSTCLCLLFVLCSTLLLPSATNAARPPASADANKKQKECLDGEDGVGAIPGGVIPVGVGGVPSYTDLDHSGPAAANGQYIPGFDDTFVPNPGYEVPRSSGHVSVP